MSDRFYRTQLCAEFVESDSPVVKLMSGYENVNSKFESRFGFKLFKELSEKDQYIYKSIRPSISDLQGEFDSQILFLSKALIDTLNKRMLEKSIVWRPTRPNENTSITFLENFMREKNLGDDYQIDEICGNFRTLQSIRSEGAAHSKSRGFAGILVGKLSSRGLQIAYQNLLTLLTDSLLSLESLL